MVPRFGGVCRCNGLGWAGTWDILFVCYSGLCSYVFNILF